MRPTNLPAGRPALVGRDAELAEVVDAVASGGERLVTITGRGGAGKTSLALLAGTELLEQHPGGVWWVDLTAVGSPDEVPLAISAVLSAERDPEGSVEVAITTRLRNSGATLVILDNMEHVLAAAGALGGLLDRLPDLRLLVSSRLPLRVDPERVIALEALDERSALELIARAVGRRGKCPKLTDADGDALREIVGLLDGLPLALELAAARLSVLTAVQLRDRLRDSIDVLGEARGGRPVRQRSLRAVLDSTLALLDPAPRALFVRLGAFAGAVELEELERVLSGDGVSVLEALAELVDAALVQRVETGDGTSSLALRRRCVRSPQSCSIASPTASGGAGRTRNGSTSWSGRSGRGSSIERPISPPMPPSGRRPQRCAGRAPTTMCSSSRSPRPTRWCCSRADACARAVRSPSG